MTLNKRERFKLCNPIDDIVIKYQSLSFANQSSKHCSRYIVLGGVFFDIIPNSFHSNDNRDIIQAWSYSEFTGEHLEYL